MLRRCHYTREKAARRREDEDRRGHKKAVDGEKIEKGRQDAGHEAARRDQEEDRSAEETRADQSR